VNNIEFPFDVGRVIYSLRLRCGLLNFFDEASRLLGGNIPISGDEFDSRQACINFVQFKDTLDRTLSGKSVYRSPFGYTNPSSYVEYMLPGLKFSHIEESKTEEVDPEMVIGCSWRQYNYPSDPNCVMDILNAAAPGSLERASFTKFCDLPFFIAAEGKNRVELFRRHNRKIRADISRKLLANTVVLLRDCSGRKWLASWQNEYNMTMFATVPFPSIALPIYRLIGVKIQSKRVPIEEKQAEESFAATMDGILNAVAVL